MYKTGLHERNYTRLVVYVTENTQANRRAGVYFCDNREQVPLNGRTHANECKSINKKKNDVYVYVYILYIIGILDIDTLCM